MKIVLACALAALALIVATHAGAGEKPAPVAVAATAPKLDLNRASVEELVSVPGIGPRMAQAIVDFRASKGSFTTFEELLQVRGVKEKTLKAITPYFAALTPPPVPSSPR